MIHLQEVLYDGATETASDSFIAGVRLQGGSVMTFTGSITGPISVSDHSHLTLTGISNNSLIEVDETSTLVLTGILNQPIFDLKGQVTVGGIFNDPSAMDILLPPNVTAVAGTLFNIRTGTWQLQDSGLVHMFSPLSANDESEILQLDSEAGTSPSLIRLNELAAALEGADDMERLSRPLLDALQDLTGLASTYLTVIHGDQDEQEIRYAKNTKQGFGLPEGLRIPWQDTLCKRALAEGRSSTNDVGSVWPDSKGAQLLGIKTYASVPVETSDGQVWGTLCAGDSIAAENVEEHLPTMRLFARLIAAQVEREKAVAKAQKEAATDPLTQCSTRRVVEPWLTAQMQNLRPEEVVLVIFTDLDKFKSVNDTLGHNAGDAVLVQVGEHLRNVARPEDLVARLGGDEFLVAARLPREAAEAMTDRVRSALSFSLPWLETVIEVQGSVGAVTSDDHDVKGLVAAADAAMYVDKRPRL